MLGGVFFSGYVWRILKRTDQALLPLNLCDQLFLCWQHPLVLIGKELWAFFDYRILEDGFIFAIAQNDADGRVVCLATLQIIKHTCKNVHLANVLVSELASLQVNDGLLSQSLQPSCRCLEMLGASKNFEKQ